MMLAICLSVYVFMGEHLKYDAFMELKFILVLFMIGRCSLCVGCLRGICQFFKATISYVS